ncbi:MAG TPA: FAD-dependent oxidoreductase [Pseudolabrys sp.]|nr:FAD-dependent oxidoreductase [Pseudolabrys sp.]
MAEVLTPDICVIGGGPGGLSVAAAAAAFGVPTVLIERHKMGGDCLNTGCVPSKALLAAARRAEMVQSAGTFGVVAQGIIDFSKVYDHVHGVIAAVAPTDSAERFSALGVRVIRETARFKDRNTVVAGEIQIRARRFVIATGSKPAVPPIPGLDGGPYLTNETIFDLRERPEHLIIIGGGPVGLEMAQAFRRFGSSVTVLEAAAKPLAKDDPECAAVVIDRLEREGVIIRSGVKVIGIAHAGHSVTATIEIARAEQTITGSHLMVATGRTPSIEGLDLDAARIRYDRTGIRVNGKLKTNNRRVYAIGDCAAGQMQFTHAANYHAELVIRNALFRLPVRVNNSAVPRVTYTEPELAQTGLTEAQARERRIRVRVARWPYHDNDRAQTERETHGHIKVITTRKGRIVGATIVGAQAGELIGLWTLAITRGLDMRALTNFVLPYPTLSELGKRVAIDFFAPSLTSPWVRRIIGWLRIFG